MEMIDLEKNRHVVSLPLGCESMVFYFGDGLRSSRFN